jgi:hemerythrin-like domain-containing protein
MVLKSTRTRREFILAGAATGSGILLAAANATAAAAEKSKTQEDVSPAEDLMREHGVLQRIMLIYNDAVNKLKSNTQYDIAPLAETAKIVRSFIEDYHSKLEEDHVFPCFEKAGKFTDLVKLLRNQHQAGRAATDQILQFAVPGKALDEASTEKLLTALRQFMRMYRPHVAREDTVVFPALHSTTAPEEYEAMGERFEAEEHRLFGQEGFEGVVEQVAAIEKKLGLYELSKFTAKI